MFNRSRIQNIWIDSEYKLVNKDKIENAIEIVEGEAKKNEEVMIKADFNGFSIFNGILLDLMEFWCLLVCWKKPKWIENDPFYEEKWSFPCWICFDSVKWTSLFRFSRSFFLSPSFSLSRSLCLSLLFSIRFDITPAQFPRLCCADSPYYDHIAFDSFYGRVAHSKPSYVLEHLSLYRTESHSLFVYFVVLWQEKAYR